MVNHAFRRRRRADAMDKMQVDEAADTNVEERRFSASPDGF